MLVLMLITAFLTGCTLSGSPSTSRQDTGAMDAASVSRCKPLSTANAGGARQIGVLAGEDRSQVLGIYSSLNGKEVFVVHGSGYVVEWRFPDGVPIRSIATAEAAIMPLGFDPVTRDLVLAVGDRISVSKGQGTTEPLTHIEVRNLTTENLTRRFSVGGSISSGTLSSSGRWLLIAEVPAALVLRDITTEIGGQALLLWEDTKAGAQQPLMTTFDSVGEWFAFTLDNEEIRLGKIAHDETLRSLGQLSGGGKPLALAFVPNRKQLAVLRDTVLELHDLRLPLFARTRNASLGGVLTKGVMTFAESGSILALATNEGWEIRDTANLHLLIKSIDQRVSSLSFSTNDCSLMIGTVDGTTQIWGLE